MKRQVFELRKKLKQMFEILISLKNSIFFLQKMRDCARGGSFVFIYIQKIRKEEYFKLVSVSIKIKVSEVRKKCRTNVCSLELDQKFEKKIFQKMHAPTIGGNFFSSN